jgi:hypothetical protein
MVYFNIKFEFLHKSSRSHKMAKSVKDNNKNIPRIILKINCLCDSYIDKTLKTLF